MFQIDEDRSKSTVDSSYIFFLSSILIIQMGSETPFLIVIVKL